MPIHPLSKGTRGQSRAMVRIVQVNVGKRSTATIGLQNWVANGNIDILLIQEPHGRKNKLTKIHGGTLYHSNSNLNHRLRSAIWVSNKLENLATISVLGEASGRDQTAIKLNLPKVGGGRQETIFCSVYCPSLDDNCKAINEPLEDISINLVEFAQKKKLELIMGGDFNAHNRLFGDKRTDKRGSWLSDYLTSTNLMVMNIGNEPTFTQGDRSSVIDLTLASIDASVKIKNWSIDKDFIESDHKAICFEYETIRCTERTARSKKKTNWSLFQKLVNLEGRALLGPIRNIDELELRSNKFKDLLTKAYHSSCKERAVKEKYYNEWYDDKLKQEKNNLRRKLRQVIGTNDPITKNSRHARYIELNRTYGYNCRKAKKRAWRKFTGELEGVKETARLQKLMEKGRPVQIGGIIKDDGNFVEDIEECAKVLITTHFPGCVELAEGQTPLHSPIRAPDSAHEEIYEATTEIKIRWALDCLAPFKAPGGDGIFPALLQKSEKISIPILQTLFRASIVLDHIPSSWRETLVTFIPKDGKSSYDTAKSFRPISLMSFILKLLEKLIDRNVRDHALMINPIDPDQHAYQTGKDTNSALHKLVSKMEEAKNGKDTLATVFVDIAGAFDNTGYDTIKIAARKRGLKEWEINWIINMLKNRTIRANLGNSKTRYKPIRGCPQGGCLSPLLWCIVIDALILLLKGNGFSVVAYADDLAISKSRPNNKSKELAQDMNLAMNLLDKWCKENNLGVNPDKTYVMKHAQYKVKEPLGIIHLNGRRIREVSEFKYLGVFIDKKLKWEIHSGRAITKAKKALWASRALVARNWGLSPKVMMWIYKQIVLPRLTYGCIVWWQRVRLKTLKDNLEKVQRIALMMVSGANRSTPTCGLVALLGDIPIHIHIEAIAIRTCARLSRNGTWVTNGPQTAHQLIEDRLALINEGSDPDGAPIRWNSNYKYKTVINERSSWQFGLHIAGNENCWYSDGSVREGKAALGICNLEKNIQKSLRISDHCTIAQAETRGIEECVRMLKPGHTRTKTLILSDSQAVIKSLRNIKIHSLTTWSCVQALREVEHSHEVTIAWVPGHSNHYGNELADKLANEGIDKPEIDIHLPIAERLIESKIEKWEIDTARAEWDIKKWKKDLDLYGQKVLRHSGEFIKGFDSKLSMELLRLKRKDLRVIVAMLTGQGCLNKYLYMIGKSDDQLCVSCQEVSESMKHVLCECNALSCRRQLTINHGFPEASLFMRLSPFTLLKLSKALNIYDVLTI